MGARSTDTRSPLRQGPLRAPGQWLDERQRRLKLGSDGAKVVAELLERLRALGAEVIHDIPADQFNLDHVVTSPRGIFAAKGSDTWVLEPKALGKWIANEPVRLSAEDVTLAASLVKQHVLRGSNRL